MAKKVMKSGKKNRKKPLSKSKGKRKGIQASKVFVYALALAALGGGSYLVYDRLKKKRISNQILPDNNAETIIINNSLPTSYSPASSLPVPSTSATRNDNFPLRRGSRGTRITLLQQALAKTNAISVDGQFGPQTAEALKAAGYSEIVDETLFNKITGSGNNMVKIVFDPASLATSLYKAAQAKSLTSVLPVLAQIKSVSEYSAVNEYYKKQSFIAKTIVTDLLEYAFKYDETAKGQIRSEFLRMGLKVDSSGTWSLQGVRLFKDLITIRETVVTDSQNNKIPVRRNTILGDEMEVANGMTWFKSIDNTILKVPSQDVKYT